MDTLSPEAFLDWSRGKEICAGVLGHPIEHSLSPLLFATFMAGHSFDTVHSLREAVEQGSYRRIDVKSSRDMEQLIAKKSDNLLGYSVTMPNKFDALKLSDFASARAVQIGSANTLIPSEELGWIADNTDVTGIDYCLDTVDPQRQIRHGIILGNGGTARPALYALAHRGVKEVIVVARSDRAMELQPLADSLGVHFSWILFDDQKLEQCCMNTDVLISTVPTKATARYIDTLVKAPRIIDVIYNPFPTPLLIAAEKQGKHRAHGIHMLAGQAYDQYTQFFNNCGQPLSAFRPTMPGSITDMMDAALLALNTPV